MPAVTIKPTDAAIRNYQSTLQRLKQQQGVEHEGGLRRAFGDLLRVTARKRNWMLVEEQSVGRVRPDGTLRDQWRLQHGFWEAKDGSDDLEVEIRRKRERGYPFSNIIFEDTNTAILYQNERRVLQADCSKRAELADLLSAFYSHEIEEFSDFEQAVARFAGEVPQIAQGLQQRINEARVSNPAFQRAFADFMALCSEALNPNISRAAVEEMLIQHLLTERLIRRVFDQENFVRRNVIAAEVEKVIDALTGQHFNRREFLGSLDRFYLAIEKAAGGLADFSDKQGFINTVYERFFQGFSVRVADTHGIVYTPQEVVEFMVAATDELLQREFGKRLGDEGVCVIDPCTGTGNFVVQLLRRVARENPRELERFYRERLFANEVMLMPYYIASLNIEHEFYERSGRYETFEGLCFVDTLDLAEGDMPEMFPEFSQRNSARVERQKKAKINVVIGNPPYNVGQINENDNNKNRKYENVDGRVRETYSKDSRASLKTKLYDAYVKFFRWASDRLEGHDGIVCLISNNSFVDGKALDGMRRELLCDFTRIYHLDLHGNVRLNPKLSGTSHNVFGIQVGVGITVAVRSATHDGHELHYHRVPESIRREEKLAYLAECVASHRGVLDAVAWQQLRPDTQHTWIRAEHADEFARFLPLGTKEAKAAKGEAAVGVEAVFKTYSLGVSTNRNAVVYDYDKHALAERVEAFVEDYNAEVDRYRRHGKPDNVDDFVKYDRVKWSHILKLKFIRGVYADFELRKTRKSVFRPFTRKNLYFDENLVDARGLLPRIFPTEETEQENQIIWIKVGADWPMFSLMANSIVDLLPQGGSQCFPLYTYDLDGTNRRENVTDWALAQFRARYGDDSISRRDIFHYVYGLLHHPGYRERHADSLRRELPRIPLAPDFAAFRDAGKELARLHLNYEHERPWQLDWETADGPVDYRVEKMRPLKRVQSEDGDYRIFDALQYNDTLTLRGIPAEAFRYRLGTRSALEWVIDQYRVKTDKRSGIVSDPNAWSENEQYIVDLVGRVVRVSVETVRIVDGLAGLSLAE